MRKVFLAILVLLSSSMIFGQKVNTGRVYKTYQDYLDNNPVKGYAIIKDSWSSVFGTNFLYIEKNGVKAKVKTTELPGNFYTEDSAGLLVRVYEKDIYVVVVEGQICYYVSRTEGKTTHEGNSWYFDVPFKESNPMRDFYSETITGEVKKLSGSELGKLLEEKGLKKRYEAAKPKREFKDTVNGYETKLKRRIIKFITLYNQGDEKDN